MGNAAMMMSDDLTLVGWNYWLKLPGWDHVEAASVLCGLEPRGANWRHYFARSEPIGYLLTHFTRCGFARFENDADRTRVSDRLPPQKWIDAFLLMDDAKLPFPLPDPDQKKTDLYPAEYKTLYRMLAAMAIDAYEFDPDKERQKATGDIVKAFAKAGLSSPDLETIRKHLKAAVRESGAKPLKT
jgi:hypothetical protein